VAGGQLKAKAFVRLVRLSLFHSLQLKERFQAMINLEDEGSAA
jgi:hypothetical protein